MREAAGFWVALTQAVLLAACARPPRIVETPAPAVLAPAETLLTVPVDTAPATDTLASYRVPPFRDGPLIEWGPTPPGERHSERVRTYDLQHQATRIRFDWARHAVIGSTTIRFAALDEPLVSATFDAVGMTIRAVRSGNGTLLDHSYDGALLTVVLRPGLAPRARTTVEIEYETERPRKGLYFVDRRHVVWTQGATEDTRYWVPTYDHPNDKATWEFRITTDRDERALSNGRLVSTRRVGAIIEWHWSQTRPASTYLMSVVTGDYVVLQDVWRGVPVGYWTYPDSIEAAWRGFGLTPRMIDLIATRTGVAYPWAKYDQAVAPDYIFGGMENVSATTQADDRVLHPAWAEPEASAQPLVAHELAHQWFGNYVTARDWPHVWLHEGFATFFEAVWAEATHGPDAGALARLAAQEESIAADRAARRPLVFDRWVTDPLELFLSGHVYARGATVLQSLRRDLGDSTFWAGIQAYMKAHGLGSVTTDDFQRSMEQASHRDLSAFFARWIHGAGFPAFRIAYRFDSSSRALTLSARQVQPRDSLTGFFEADVVVEVMTDAGTVLDTLPVRGEESSLVMALPAPPRSIRWDKGGWLLDIADFPRPTVMLEHQLARDDDLLGRIEAAELLGARTGDPRAVPALGRALERDTAWAVRARAAASLATHTDDSVAAIFLVRATVDRDSRVRTAAATALGRLALAASHRDPVLTRLRTLTSNDSSRFVRGAALIAYARLDSAGAFALIRSALARESWRDTERVAAVAALAELASPEAWALLLRELGPESSRAVRQAAIASLTRTAAGREPELAAALAPLLDADDLYIRSAAARALGALGQQGSIPALEARLAVEAESRVINVIRGALASLRSGRRLDES